MQTVCVFCSSSDKIDESFRGYARQLGVELGKNNYQVVYGGTTTGLMGTVATSAQENGSNLIGVIPESLKELGLTNQYANEIRVCKDLRERKGIMDELSDAFIALPGGLGTYEELIEVLNLKFLGYHEKPIILLNPNGFFNPFLVLLEHLFETKFTPQEIMQLFEVVENVEACIESLRKPKKASITSKYLIQSKVSQKI
jgi:hypothetical protein